MLDVFARPAHLATFVIIFVSLKASAALPSAYQLIPLGALGERNYAYAINDKGEAVGNFYTSADDSDFHSFVYRGGAMIDLFPGQPGSATGINGAGTIVGFGAGAPPYGAWECTGTTRTPIPTPAGRLSYAYGINDQGVVVGHVSAANGNFHPFTYDTLGMHDLGLPAGANNAYGSGINEHGDVVGVASRAGLNYAVLFTAGTWRYLSESFDEGWAFSINDSGVVVGYVRPNAAAGTNAFRYSNGVLTRLLFGAFANSWANAINDQGIIVGTYGPDENRRALVVDGNTMLDLNDLLPMGSGWTLRWANDVNNQGEIVGWGVDPTGRDRAFLLEPLVPEPAATPCLIAMGMALFCRRSLRHRSRLDGTCLVKSSVSRADHACRRTPTPPDR